MNRLWYGVVLSCWIGLTVCPCISAQDLVRFYDRKAQKEDQIRGTIAAESPVTVKVKMIGGRVEDIPALDILEIEYQSPRGVIGSDYRRPFLREHRAQGEKGAARKKLLLEALEAFQELDGKLEEALLVKRNVEYHKVLVLAQLAQEDAAQLEAALSAVKKFKADQGGGWQLAFAVKLQVQLLEQKGDTAGALAAYEDMADNAALPGELRQEFSLLVVRFLLHQNKHEEAARRVKKAEANLSRDDPQAVKLRVYLAACELAARHLDGIEKPLEEVLKSSASSEIKALARNTLGDYYRARGRQEDAFWQYLWVDVYYNQDREEVSRALYHLAKLFVEVRKDTVRAQECLDRLCDEKEFGGLEYHKRALAEKPGSSGN